MALTQLNPTIPLRSPKASGEAIAVIDYSIEHDLMWVIVDDETGQVWTVPNSEVRAYKNYSAGRNNVDVIPSQQAQGQAELARPSDQAVARTPRQPVRLPTPE